MLDYLGFIPSANLETGAPPVDPCNHPSRDAELHAFPQTRSPPMLIKTRMTRKPRSKKAGRQSSLGGDRTPSAGRAMWCKTDDRIENLSLQPYCSFCCTGAQPRCNCRFQDDLSSRCMTAFGAQRRRPPPQAMPDPLGNMFPLCSNRSHESSRATIYRGDDPGRASMGACWDHRA